MVGPAVPWRPGRVDRDVAFCTPDGRLPDGAKGQDHLRAIFYRMGFDDREIVALSGAHALGRCHADRSGFEGPWTFSPTVVSNDYFRLLLDEKWHYRKVSAPLDFSRSLQPITRVRSVLWAFVPDLLTACSEKGGGAEPPSNTVDSHELPSLKITPLTHRFFHTPSGTATSNSKTPRPSRS